MIFTHYLDLKSICQNVKQYGLERTGTRTHGYVGIDFDVDLANMDTNFRKKI